MADSITIGGEDLRLVAFDQGDSEWRGEDPRAFDNTLLDGRDGEKRTWSGETDWMTQAEEAALRTTIASGPVTCSGLVMGESVLASVRVTRSGRGPDVQTGPPDYTGINVKLAITLREV